MALRADAKTLIETIWGSNFFDSLPAKWKSTLKMKRYKTPGVPNGTLPDAISEVDLSNLMEEIVATSQVTTNRTNELEKITEKIQVALLLTTTTSGQDYDEEFDLVIPYTEHLALNGAEVGDARKEIRPLNPILSEVKTLDLTAFNAVLDNYLLSFPGTTNVDAPDFLNEVKIYTESSHGDGSSNETTIFAAASGEYSFTLPYRATAQGSAMITKEVVPIYTPIGGAKRGTIHYMFFLPIPVTAAQVTAKLAALTGESVTNWAVFTPKPVTVVVIAKRISLQVNATFTQHSSLSSGGSAGQQTGGTGYSREIEMVVRTTRIPPMVHGNLIIDGVGGPGIGSMDITEDSPDVSVSASVPTQSLTKTEPVSCRIIADGMLATGGATSLPSSGLLIVGTNGRPYKHGYAQIQTETIDASTLQS